MPPSPQARKRINSPDPSSDPRGGDGDGRKGKDEKKTTPGTLGLCPEALQYQGRRPYRICAESQEVMLKQHIVPHTTNHAECRVQQGFELDSKISNRIPEKPVGAIRCIVICGNVSLRRLDSFIEYRTGFARCAYGRILKD